MLLNNRGRIVEDLILYRQASDILIESDRKNQSKLRNLFEMFKVQKDVSFEEETENHVYHADSITNDIPGIEDPRVPSFGKRILSKIIAGNNQLCTIFFMRKFSFSLNSIQK